ncbi:hypothetical protein [Bacillus sp. RAR_GA_16]|uniref:hypothetical protein n=1 Tax=Bacillus sp. RAR_GA_16 TaxID=2876774 RepID=UPI001CCAA7BC|nr:hypothetical protein [Bacillus sp. RAR_GA_16]MCA0173616.1 hypothetical protein [Bacillus sp. RAR_GA_16]
MSQINRRTVVGLLVGLLALALILLFPVFLWYMEDQSTSDIAIIDKTIPDETYREHKGLTWILNYKKWMKQDDTPYNASEDYIGFHPEGEKQYNIDSFPDSLVGKDLIYLADSYGVYEDDWYGKESKGDRSEIIYGGMTQEEVSVISEAVQRGSTFIAEFNAFGSPTDEKARQGLYSTLNLEWSGWIGRYFDDLSVDGEVPGWAIKNYEKQYNKEWNFSKQGLLFVNEDDSIIVIEKDEIGEQTVQFSFNENGQKWLGGSLIKKAMSYHYWFDIVEPVDKDEVLANYAIDVSPEAEELLKESGIPLSFPAVMRHNHSYYFAGDYADHDGDLNVYQYKWLPAINRLLTTGDNETLEAFYWKVYMPMMETILQNLENAEENEVSHVNIPTVQGVKVAGRVGEDNIQVFQDGGWEDFLIKGVNMGISKPGYFPGEAAITKSEYKRWFDQISEMNANAIRIYTIHPPAFYEALLEHNQEAEKPLYLFHGVWVEEEPLLETKDAFAKENEQLLEKAMKDTVDLIHGNATIKEKVGHAGGRYTADVSPYVLGWVLGIEWDPEVVVATNEKHSEMKQYKGSYLNTKDASPFEIWVANMMDDTVRYEMENYNYQRPVSFTNWVTTDLLRHPAEPSEEEDMVSVDPNVIELKDNYYAGQFASYHIYPYYPDFLNYEEEYVNYVDQHGNKNNYAGYLNALRKVHKMPVLVAEFGVPASRGMTHRNVYGMNQGGNSEEKQGEIDARLFENIVSENYAGGMVFSWQDEWFKRTWNTMDFDNEDRRPFWSNDQTNEQQFGLLSFDPGKQLKIKIDGDLEDWKNEKPLFESKNKDQNLQRSFMTSDEKYIYFRLDYQTMSVEQLEKDKTMLLFDTINGQGSKELSEDPKLTTSSGIDFILNLTGKETSRLTVQSYYDSFYYQYAKDLGLIEEKSYASKEDNNVFHPIRLALNKKLTIPSTNETLPFDDYETGILTYGNGNPESEDYNSLSDFIVKGNSIEIRLPWALFHVKDPSEKEIMGDMWKEGLKASKKVDRFKVGVVMYEGEDVNLSLTSINETRPATKNGQLDEFYEFTWDKWREPNYHERLKQSYYIMQEEFSRYKE